MAALVAVYLACFRDYRGMLAPGEVATVMLIASDRKQARVVMRYITGLLDSVPMLRQLVAHRTAESVTLSNRVVIEVHTASFRSVRGYSIAAVICDEIAFWRSEDSANPDVEIINALRPAMATMPGSSSSRSAVPTRAAGRCGRRTSITMASRAIPSSPGKRTPPR